MKKLSLLIIAVVIAFSVNAQKIGFKVGTNLAGMTIDDLSSAALDLANIDGKMRPGMQLGLVIEKDLIPLIDLRIEALYTQKGSIQTSTDYAGTGATLDVNSTYNYFEVPIMAKVKFGPVYVTAGPYFGYALSGTVSTTLAGVTTDAVMDFATAGINQFDYGVNAGIGAQFGIGPLGAFVEARGGMGMANMYETPTADEFMKNMGLALSVGILLGK